MRTSDSAVSCPPEPWPAIRDTDQGGCRPIGNLELACRMGDRLRGLLGRDRAPGVLMLAPCSDIHTVGMAFPIDVAFVGPDGVVVASRRNLVPGKRMTVRGAVCAIERQAVPERRWFCPGDQVVVGVREEV